MVKKARFEDFVNENTDPEGRNLLGRMNVYEVRIVNREIELVFLNKNLFLSNLIRHILHTHTMSWSVKFPPIILMPKIISKHLLTPAMLELEL